MDKSVAKEVFNELYKNVNGHNLSLQGRNTQDLNDKSFVYGEVKFDTFYNIIQDLGSNNPKGVFYDLGSGTGKAVFLAHLLFDFSKSIGIELIDPLYKASVEVKDLYEKEFRPKLKEYVDDREIIFHRGSFLDFDISDADVIFMNSTCYSDELMAALDEKFETLKPGTRFISLSKPLRKPYIEVKKSYLTEFSWGEATVFCQQRR